MLPVVHCLDFEILLVLRGATQSERFCIGDKTVSIGYTLNICHIRSFFENDTREPHGGVCLVDHNISVFGVKFLFGGIVPETLWNCST